LRKPPRPFPRTPSPFLPSLSSTPLPRRCLVRRRIWFWWISSLSFFEQRLEFGNGFEIFGPAGAALEFYQCRQIHATELNAKRGHDKCVRQKFFVAAAAHD